jgi:hypothetical protein
VPWSVAKDARTQTRQDLGTGPIQVPQNWDVQIKGQLTDAMRLASMRAGQGHLFDEANTRYAQLQPVLDRLYDIGGRPVGGGAFRDSMNEAQAARELTKGFQSPSEMENLADSRYFPSENFRRAAGQHISTMGETKQESFRPEKFYEDVNKKVSPDSLSMLTQGPTGGPSVGAGRLLDASTVASNYSTPIARHNLIQSAGTALAVNHVLNSLGKFGYPAAWLVARGMESPQMLSAMSGRSAGVGRELYSTLPRIGTIADQERFKRLQMSPAAPYIKPPGT